MRHVRFLFRIKICVLPTHTVYNFFFLPAVHIKEKCVLSKKFKIPYIHFLQCALSDFFIFASKFEIHPRTQFSIFSSFKGTYQRNRCTSKIMLKSHIFIFYSAPCQISLYLHQTLCFTYSHSLQLFSSSKGTY